MVFFMEIFFGKIRPILDTENDFETQNFEIFDKVVHNFGKSDEVIIEWKNACFQQLQTKTCH